MNERLKELAEQAEMEWDTHIWCWLANPPHLEKFAELVRQDDRTARGAVLRKQDEQIKEMQLTNARLFEKFNKAVLAEREACAVLCEEQDEYGCGQYAKAIRARGTPSPAFKNYIDDNWAGIV